MRRPSRHGRGVSSTRSFSSFGRSIERVASAKRKPGMLKPHQKDRTESSGDAFTKNKMKQKIVQSGSSSEDEDEKTVQADFSFFDPKPDDFHGVKMLLQNYLDSKQWDLSGFVDLLLGQPTVGTVIKIEDSEDDTPFCIISALNLGRYKDQKCIKEFKDFMLNASPKDLTHNLRMHLKEHPHSVGLLVSQRVVNLPPQLLPPLYDALFDEVSWATEDEPTEELRKSFRFKTYLIATRIYRLKNVNRQKGTSKGSKEDPIIYIKLEDELFLKLSSWSFNFALQTEQLANQELRNYKLTGLVMCVEAEKIQKFRKQLHSLIEEA